MGISRALAASQRVTSGRHSRSQSAPSVARQLRRRSSDPIGPPCAATLAGKGCQRGERGARPDSSSVPISTAERSGFLLRFTILTRAPKARGLPDDRVSSKSKLGGGEPVVDPDLLDSQRSGHDGDDPALADGSHVQIGRKFGTTQKFALL